MTYNEKLFFESLISRGTGSGDIEKIGKTLDYKFGKYIIKIALSDNNEFRGITELKINKDFLEFKKKSTPKGFHDVEEFYKE